MKALTGALLLLVAACGRGKAIFNVDVYSFLAGTGKNTVTYIIPPPPAGSATGSQVQKINLPPGFGSSIVDTVRITNGSANLVTTSGSGRVGFQMYVAADSAGTYNAGALALSLPDTAVSAGPPISITISGDLSAAVNAIFTQPTVWIRLVATGTNPNALPVTGLQGQMVLTALTVRVIMQDKIF
jgi:hypothetical protein